MAHIKLIITLATAALMLAGAVLATDAYIEMRHAERSLAEQQMRTNTLRNGLRKVRQIKKDAQRFAEAMNKAEEAGLKPGVWIDYPVDINRELSWNEVSNIIGLASQGGPRSKGYWYNPKAFNFALIEGSDDNQEQELSADMHLGIRGEFLMPKPSGKGAGGWYAPWFENLRQLKDAYSVKQ